MKRGILFVMTVVAMLVFIVPLSHVDADSATNYTIRGYVAEWEGTKKMPMDGVTVSIIDQNGTELGVVETDSTGLFNVVVSTNVNLSISFNATGYAVISCPNTSIREGSEYLTLNLSTSNYDSSTRTYTITSMVNEMQCVLMMAVDDVVVTGTVSFNHGHINNATVKLTSVEGGGTYTVITDENGRYELTCPIGLYTLVVTRQGFESSNEISINVTSNSSPFNVLMEETELKKYFGLDAAHILMLIGVIVGILLAISAWFMSKRMNGPNRLEIFDDSIEDDDDIRHP